ncbi:ABC transporter ATP-binding protein [Halalkalibacter urbisdiaboli]|uniref:ABC transporter ATP-binding protein n=1 Tax=Halalkalibacter urbisdiaboli TaxID=1960589 RepID=UPI000B451119|nr:ABC transporter ATP-binding protein [Halalkalibacter urbisdiaboli]
MRNQLLRPFQYEKIELPKNNETTKGNSKTKDWAGTLRRLWGYLAAYQRKLLFVVLLVILSSALGLLGPFLIGIAIDRYLVTLDGQGLIYWLIGLLVVYILYSVTLWLQNMTMIQIAQRTIYSLRTQLFTHLHKLSIPFFDKRQHGELMSRATNDIENISSTLNTSVIQIISSVLTFIGILAVMLWLSPLLTALTLTIIPFMVFGMKWITKRTGTYFKEQQRHVGDMNGYIEETISGQKIVKTFSQEQRVIDEFYNKNQRLRKASFWAQTYSGFIPKLMNVLNNLSFTIIAAIGGVMALNQMISIGVIVIFTEYARQFTRPLNDLANQFNTLLSAVAGAERVFEMLDEPIERDVENAISLPSIKGDVTFNNVSFSYGEEKTLSNVSFEARAGETIALVGPTGAGKTTIINLLSRFYEFDSGQILLDGYDITKMKRENIRKQMAFVLQDTFLFEGTIRENIRYGKLKASDKEVEEAAKQANAHSFICKMTNGYDTVLSQDGGGISQGQRQLLAIARAILADPTLLILDEATSNIDTMTEIKIQEALQRLLKGRTSFVIAHRLNTVRQADKILVLQEGKVIEIGTHESLIEAKGHYFEMQAR